MARKITRIYHRVLVFLHLSPLSLAEKCRMTFGAAVFLVLAVVLLCLYIWMGQLTRQSSIDASRAKVEILYDRHFQPERTAEVKLARLSLSGVPRDPNEIDVLWVLFGEKGVGEEGEAIPVDFKEMIESVRGDENRDELTIFEKRNGVVHSTYVSVVRATETCVGCHNAQGPARAFGLKEPIGAVVVQRPVSGMGTTILLNRIFVILAGIIGGTVAIVVFYIITQRVILRPIRQLRALANNVAEGNLDVRSAINTRDEYQKLSDAFNHMLDHLQQTQSKVREANRQLDAKISELSTRNIELFKANQVKSEFLANMSHEFRTPLNAILGFAEVLKDKPDALSEEKNRRYVEHIMTAGKNLLTMINDLLDLAKTEAGKMRLHIGEVVLPDLCRSIVASFSQMTRQKKIKVRVTEDGSIPMMMTDAAKVQQILFNFLSNAVKFTPEEGRIEVNLRMLDDKTVRISVVDTGCGIAESDQERIFEKFRQLDGSLTRSSAGTGLGLAISKELAAMLAGTIGLESEIDKGSTFWIDIPISLSVEEAEGGG